MSDSSMPAGWYEAPGDPPGTKRYWTALSGPPIP